MMEMFQKFVTPEQRQLAFLVEQKGGDAIIDNEQVMKELSDAEALISAPAGMETLLLKIRMRSTARRMIPLLPRLPHPLKDQMPCEFRCSSL